MSAAEKKLFVKTYGCQMNVYDSERMAGALAARGYEPVATAEDADLILLNTCHIREKAAEKVYSELGRLRRLKIANPDLRIGVAGCVAQAEGAEILARASVVDLVVGPQAYHRLPDMLDRRERGERPVETEFPAEDKFDHLPADRRARRAPAAFLTVQEGCDKFCAFCVVPYTRGAEVSRPAARIEAEARALVDRGVVEITLLGQNVNAYSDPAGTSLAALVRRLARIAGLARIRYTTSHPNDMADDLIAAHGDEPKLMPFLHLPVQSGSDRVLKAMNRRHTRRDATCGWSSASARPGPTWRSRAISSSASPARPRPTSARRWRWSRRWAMRRPIPSPIPRARARPPRSGPRSILPSARSGCSGCRRCWRASRPTSSAPSSARCCRC